MGTPLTHVVKDLPEMQAPGRSPVRLLAWIVAAGMLLGIGPAVGLGAAPASADTAPPSATTPPTVSADALPTVQVDGVVWSQVTIGNTVYAGGKFTTARPAGAAPGTSTTPRNNLLAYDIRTGALITSFAPNLNAQVRGLSASPDGSRLYVAGEFTQANGANRYRIAAYSTATGLLISTFAPALDYRATSVVATETTVYVGGAFNKVGGTPRSRLAAFRADNGALLSWAPSADAQVLAMVLTPDRSKLVVGGQFANLSGSAAYGMGALDLTSGTVLPWAANQLVRNAGQNAAINSLRSDGTQVYGTGFVFGPGGNLEGTFAADSTGKVNWIEDCHGDSYDTFTTGQVLYNVSHSHYCGNIGSFPETNPRSFSRATAFTTYPTRTIGHDPYGYYDFFGNAAPTQLDWYPTLDAGTYTGQNQAAWSATGNASYVALGGEFPRVNGAAQQGLVRFAIRALAPNRVGPKSSTGLTPTLASPSAGTVRVSWTATSDQDNEALTYKVVRDGATATPIFTTTVNSTFYRLPALSFNDTGLAAGSTHSYRIDVTDPLGNRRSGGSSSVTVSSAATSRYAQDVTADGAVNYWRLGETTGTTGFDSVGGNDLVEQSGVGRGVAGAIAGDSNGASPFNGSSAGVAAATRPTAGPSTFTTEAWFTTTTTRGGKILGLGNASTGTSSSYDRHVYMDNAGHLVFGVYPGGVRTLTTPGTYNNGQWHHVVASLSAAGMVLYVDGKQVAFNAGVTGAESYTGYWRIGGDNLNAWPSLPTSSFFAGTIDEVAIYGKALSLAQVQRHYADSGRTVAP